MLTPIYFVVIGLLMIGMTVAYVHTMAGLHHMWAIDHMAAIHHSSVIEPAVSGARAGGPAAEQAAILVSAHKSWAR
jgi:hypothetical protein